MFFSLVFFSRALATSISSDFCFIRGRRCDVSVCSTGADSGIGSVGVRWEQSWVEGLVLIPALVTVLVDVVPVPIEWFQLVPILPPATLPVALVSGHVMASFLPTGFPNSEVETK